MNILFLTHRFPYPPNRGDRIRSYHMLRYLSEHADVWLGTLSAQPPDKESSEVLARLCKGTLIEHWHPHWKWLRAAWSFLCGRTLSEGLFHSRRLHNRLEKLAQTVQFDGIVVFCSSMAQYLDTRSFRDSAAGVIIDLVDVDSQKWYDYAEKAHGWRKWIYHTEGSRLRKLETELEKRCDALVVVTPEELATYKSFCKTEKIYAVPNGVDSDFFSPAPDTQPIPKRCVFVGALDYHANLDGITWFIQNIWPELIEKHPEAQLDVVGSNPGAQIKRLAQRSPGVNLVGEVEDVRPYLHRSCLVTVPLRVARGIQNKVLEGMAVGKAVIASPESVEGIQAQDGEHLCICSTPREWIMRIDELFQDPARRITLGKQARERILQCYSWDAQLSGLGDLLF